MSRQKRAREVKGDGKNGSYVKRVPFLFSKMECSEKICKYTPTAQDTGEELRKAVIPSPERGTYQVTRENDWPMHIKLFPKFL